MRTDDYAPECSAAMDRQAGFSVEAMTASYEVISDLVIKIGQGRAISPGGARAWCAAIRHAE